MMTKDEAKELTRKELYEMIGLPNSFWVLNTIEQNWPQISKQLDEWFSEENEFGGEWWQDGAVNSDPIGWMLRAFVASKESEK